VSLLAISLATIGVIVGIVAGGLAILGVILGPYRNRPRLRLRVYRDYGLAAGSLSFTVHVFNDGRSTVNNIRMVAQVGNDIVGENAGLVHIRPHDPLADTRISIPEPEFVIRRDDETLDFPRGEPVFCAFYRYLGWRWKKCEPWPSVPEARVPPLTGAQPVPSTLSVRVGGGFDGNEQRVRINAVIDNDGERIERGIVVEALIDGEPIASSAPVDVTAEGSQTVDIDVPRRYIVNLAGEHPVYTGEFRLRARSRSGTSATFIL
jgi:hypothetical protein